MIKSQAELNCFTNRGLGQRSFDTNQVFVLFQIIIANDLVKLKRMQETTTTTTTTTTEKI